MKDEVRSFRAYVFAHVFAHVSFLNMRLGIFNVYFS